MQITAKQLHQYAGIIFIDDQIWDTELVEADEWNHYDRAVIEFSSRDGSYDVFLYPEDVIELDNTATGVIQLRNALDDGTISTDPPLRIQAFVLTPLTAVEMAKKAIGITS